MLEIVPHRVKPALVGPHVDGLVRDVFGKSLQTDALQLLLQLADVGIGHRTRRKVVFADKRLHQHRRAQHLVVVKMARPLRAQANQDVGQHRQRLAGLAFDTGVEPFPLGVVERSEAKNVVIHFHAFFATLCRRSN